MVHVKQPGYFVPCLDRLVCPLVSLHEGRTVWAFFSSVFFSVDECAMFATLILDQTLDTVDGKKTTINNIQEFEFNFFPN